MEFDKILAPLVEEAQLTWKYRWAALLCAWLAAAGGWAVVRMMPDQYEASARVYVNADTVLKPLLQGLTVPTDPVAQVNLMTRALLSRPHLNTVLTKTGLEARATTKAQRERLLSRLQVDVRVTKVDREPIYDISYTDANPAMAQAVVQALLDDFMTDALAGDTEQTAQAEEFLRGQIRLYEERLTEAEERLADFKRRNMGLVQGDGETDYYARFQAAQATVESLQSQVRSLTNRRNELERQLEGQTAGGAGSGGSTSVDSAIGNLEAELAQLQLRFTERHPDVVRIRQTLEELFRVRKEELRLQAAGNGSSRRSDPVYEQTRIALGTANADLAALQSQLAEKIAQVNYLRGMANTIPDVEAQLVRLNRDYDVVKTEYDTLLKRLESAKMNQEVQADKKNVQFEVLEPPHTPLAPAGPDRFQLNTVVLLGALGLGFGLAYFLSHRDPPFYSAASLREVAGLPVYGLVGVAGGTSAGPRVWRFGLASGALLLAYALILAFGRAPV